MTPGVHLVAVLFFSVNFVVGVNFAKLEFSLGEFTSIEKQAPRDFFCQHVSFPYYAFKELMRFRDNLLSGAPLLNYDCRHMAYSKFTHDCVVHVCLQAVRSHERCGLLSQLHKEFISNCKLRLRFRVLRNTANYRLPPVLMFRPEEIDSIAEHASEVQCNIPYITAKFELVKDLLNYNMLLFNVAGLRANDRRKFYNSFNWKAIERGWTNPEASLACVVALCKKGLQKSGVRRAGAVPTIVAQSDATGRTPVEDGGAVENGSATKRTVVEDGSGAGHSDVKRGGGTAVEHGSATERTPVEDDDGGGCPVVEDGGGCPVVEDGSGAGHSDVKRGGGAAVEQSVTGRTPVGHSGAGCPAVAHGGVAGHSGVRHGGGGAVKRGGTKRTAVEDSSATGRTAVEDDGGAGHSGVKRGVDATERSPVEDDDGGGGGCPVAARPVIRATPYHESLSLANEIRCGAFRSLCDQFLASKQSHDVAVLLRSLQ